MFVVLPARSTIVSFGEVSSSPRSGLHISRAESNMLGGQRMSDHFFISYSSVDGIGFSLKLADELAAGPPPIPVWVDKRNLRPCGATEGLLSQPVRWPASDWSKGDLLT